MQFYNVFLAIIDAETIDVTILLKSLHHTYRRIKTSAVQNYYVTRHVLI